MVRYRLPCTVTVGVPGAQDTGDYREIIHCFLALAGAVFYKYRYKYNYKSIHCSYCFCIGLSNIGGKKSLVAKKQEILSALVANSLGRV